MNKCSLGGTGSPSSRAMRSADVELPADFGEMEAQVGEHPGVLRALSREEERQLPGEWFIPVIGAAAVAGTERHAGSPAEAARQPSFSARSASDDATRPSRTPPADGWVAAVQRIGDVLERSALR